MIEYKIEIVEGRKKYPVMLFANPQYALLSEFFLAERSFLKELKRFVKANEQQFSGNAFTLYQNADSITLENDMNDASLTVNRKDFYSLLCVYYDACKKLRK